jgi:hypothetical protein
MATPSLTVTGGDNPDEPVSYPTFDGRRVQLTPNNNANSPSQSSIQAQAPPRDMARPKRTDTMETITPFVDAQETLPDSPEQTDQQKQQLRRLHSTVSYNSKMSVPPPGSVLTGKQEHYLKRELISQQTRWEIRELRMVNFSGLVKMVHDNFKINSGVSSVHDGCRSEHERRKIVIVCPS